MKNINHLITLIAFLWSSVNLSAVDTYIKADDPAIQYMGRIDFSNPKAPAFSFPGISIKAKFNGTHIAAVIKDFSIGGAQTTNYYNVLIDDVITFKLRVYAADTLYTLADGLTAGDHTVELIKRTESSVGKSSFLGFVIEGTALLSLPAKSSYKIEFIGDSWTCGYGNEVSTNSPNTGFHSVNEDNSRAWGYTVAKKFDAQYHGTAISGRGMYRNNNGTTTGVMPDEFDKIFAGQSTPLWNHNNYIPDLVVIHLGTNDFFPQTWATPSMLDSASYVDKYIAFINTLRTVYGSSTKILCVFGNSITDYWPSGLMQLTHWRNYINAVVGHFNGNGDNEVYKFELSPQAAPYGEDWHPTIVTHNQMANQIAPYITTITGRSASSYQAGTGVINAVTLPDFDSGKLKVFPNPATNELMIEEVDAKTEWSIMDATGSVCKKGTGNKVLVNDLKVGVYFLHTEGYYIRIVKI